MKKFIIGSLSLIVAVVVGLTTAFSVSFINNSSFRNDINSYVGKDEENGGNNNVIADNSLDIIEDYKLQLDEKKVEINNIKAELNKLQLDYNNNVEEIKYLENKINELESSLDSNKYTTIQYSETHDTDKFGRINVNNNIEVGGVGGVENLKDSNIVKYGNSFIDESLDIDLGNISYNTKRFVSKDGDKIYFCLDNLLICYKNTDGDLIKLYELDLDFEIYNLSAFDNYLFLFSKTAPYITSYYVDEFNYLTQCDFISFSEIFNVDYLSSLKEIDVVQARNGTFMLGVLSSINNNTALTVFCSFDKENKRFVYNNHTLTDGIEYTYLLSYHSNTMSDAYFYFIYAGSSSSKCKKCIHNADGTYDSSYSSLSYYFTYKTTDVKIKSFAFLVQKDFSTSFWLYIQELDSLVRYLFTDISQGIETFVSSNLIYQLQKIDDNNFKCYSFVDLVDLKSNEISLSECEISLPNSLNFSEIVDVEILNNVFLFFMSDGTVKVYTTVTDKTMILNLEPFKTYDVYIEKNVDLEELKTIYNEKFNEIEQKLSELDSMRNDLSVIQSEYDLKTQKLQEFLGYHQSYISLDGSSKIYIVSKLYEVNSNVAKYSFYIYITPTDEFNLVSKVLGITGCYYLLEESSKYSGLLVFYSVNDNGDYFISYVLELDNFNSLSSSEII